MADKSLAKFVNLISEIIPKGRPNRLGTRISVTSITIHNTSNSDVGADAKAHSKFVREVEYYEKDGKKKWVSWHFTVDDGIAIQQLPVNELALHAGPANASSVAIEICMHSGIDQDVANVRAATLVAGLLFDLKLTVRDLKTHHSWTGKNCPVLLLDNEVVKWPPNLGPVD